MNFDKPTQRDSAYVLRGIQAIDRLKIKTPEQLSEYLTDLRRSKEAVEEALKSETYPANISALKKRLVKLDEAIGLAEDEVASRGNSK